MSQGKKDFKVDPRQTNQKLFTTTDVANELHIPVFRVLHLLRKHNVPCMRLGSSRIYNQEQVDQIKKIYRETGRFPLKDEKTDIVQKTGT